MGNDKKFDIEELLYNITMENPGMKDSYTDKNEKYCKCEKDDKFEKHCKKDKYDKCDKYDDYDKCKKDHKSDCLKTKEICLDPCELCKIVKAEPIAIDKKGARLLTVKVKICNVCFDKKVAVAVIIYDKCRRIVAFKGFTTMLSRDCECGRDACGTIERKLIFVIPDQDLCDILELDVRVIANYVYPCEPLC